MLPYPFNKKTTKRHVNTDPKGVATVKDFRQGEYIRLIDKHGKSGVKTYIRGEYDRSTKKYHLVDTNDVYGNGRYVKGTTKAHDNFTF